MNTTPSDNQPASRFTQCHAMKQRLGEYWKQLRQKRAIAFIAMHVTMLLFMALLVIAFFLNDAPAAKATHATATSTSSSTQYYLDEKLTDIQGKLSVIERQLRVANSHNADELKQDLQTINQQIQQGLQQNNQTLQAGLQTNNQQLQQQLAALTSSMNQLQQTMQPVTYLKADVLPFDVIALDSIEGQPIATLFYHDSTFPMETGEWIAGWKLSHADITKQQTVFVNRKGQQVRVQLSSDKVV